MLQLDPIQITGIILRFAEHESPHEYWILLNQLPHDQLVQTLDDNITIFNCHLSTKESPQKIMNNELHLNL